MGSAALRRRVVPPGREGAFDTYEFPSYALYGHETLRFIGTERDVTAAVIGSDTDGLRFPRR